MTAARRRTPEQLAPAGDLERLESALRYGADAVYLGRDSFSMRAAAGNFHSAQQLGEAVALAHAAGKKVYLTCNTLPRNEEIPQFDAFLQEAVEAGADALILADLGLLYSTVSLVELGAAAALLALTVTYLLPSLCVRVKTHTLLSNTLCARLLR